MKPLAWAGVALLAAVPLTGIGNYPLHLMIMCLLWAYVYTSWSIMGRLGLVSFGHGAFLGIGAYAVVMLWNHFGISPWLGAPVAVLLSRRARGGDRPIRAFASRSSATTSRSSRSRCPRSTRLVIVALRDQTGGSLGVTPNTALRRATPGRWPRCSSPTRWVWFYIVLAFWLGGLWIWARLDRSMTRLALEAISQEEDAAASSASTSRARSSS